MASAEVQASPAEAAPGVPDYLASPNAILGDIDVQWRYGRAPDYTKTRKVWEEGKKMNHVAGSLPQLVENLVKNWEVEASFKPQLKDWRTVDHENYSFAINGGPPQSAEHMLKVGTYNAIIAPNEYYSPENSDFASSHKTFKRMMPTFAWEVIEVYSGPPRVSFKWRHWGQMKNDYVGFNDKGEKIVAKAHGGPIEIFGVTVANVDDKVRLQALDTWFDPLDMFRQIAPGGIVNKETMNRNMTKEAALGLDSDDHTTATNTGADTYAEKLKPDTTDRAATSTGHNGEHATATASTSSESHPSPAQPLKDVLTPSTDSIVPNNDGLKIAEVHNKDVANIDALEDIIPKHDSTSTKEAADAPIPHQGADTRTTVEGQSVSQVDGTLDHLNSIIDTAASYGAAAEVVSPTSNFHDALEKQQDSSLPLAYDSRAGLPRVGVSTEKSWEHLGDAKAEAADVPRSDYSSAVTGDLGNVVKTAHGDDYIDEQKVLGAFDAVDEHLDVPSEGVHSHPHDAEELIHPQPGEAIAVPATAEETVMTHEEMSRVSGASECPFLMNRE